MKNDRQWFVQARATEDGSDDIIVDLPDALLEEMGLVIGDDLAITVSGDTIILTPIRELSSEPLGVDHATRAQAEDRYRNRMQVLLNIPRDATAQQIHEMIEAGFEATVLMAMRDSGLIDAATQDAIVPSRTLKMKLTNGEPLTTSQSDHLFRLAHIIASAESFFGDSAKVMRWLSKPKKAFLGKSPIEMLSTTIGSHQVDEFLMQATEGMSL
ncbi:antitoxin Xre/MbcA/ParS toxin-binding domain-containing protein [Pseudomonas neuropathica]